MDGLSSSEGRVQVYSGEAWAAVCQDAWDLNDAIVVCRELGFEQAIDVDEFFGQVNGQEIIRSGLECVGNETTVSKCRHSGLGDGLCQDRKVAGLRCGE